MLNERYQIFRKLGYGSYSTVWLAKDLQNQRYVAVKFHSLRAEYREPCEVRHPNVEHMLDRFVHKGMNGSHVCIVLEPIGRSLMTVVESWLLFKFGHKPEDEEDETCEPHRWSLKISREICRQLLLGLDSLHSQQIAHRDIHPGNIAFALSYDINSMSMDEIQQFGAGYEDVDHVNENTDWDAQDLRRFGTSIARIKRVDGKPLESREIQYTVQSKPLNDRLIFDNDPHFRILLIDLGDSQKFEDCNQRLYGPSSYRAPEAILPIDITYKADIFSLGLVFWETVMSRNIVCAEIGDDMKPDDNQYIKEFITRIGSMPEHFQQIFPLKDSFRDEEMLDPENYAHGDMRFAARRDRPEDMTDADIEVFLYLMKQMMQWEPEKRPTTRQLLKHPFFATSYK